MKSSNLLVVFIVGLLLGCAKHNKICQKAQDKMMSQTFTGTIYLCNAQPPYMDNIEATANVSSIGSGIVSIHLISDTTLIDTLLSYNINCQVVETDIPIIFFEDDSQNEKGQYNQTPDRISFSFNYQNCINNTHFEGLAN